MASTKPAAKATDAKAGTAKAADTTAAADAKAAAPAQTAKPAAKAPAKKPGLIVSTRKGVKSFRRAGQTFTEVETTIALESLKDDQVAALKAESMLNVREVEDIDTAVE